MFDQCSTFSVVILIAGVWLDYIMSIIVFMIFQTEVWQYILPVPCLDNVIDVSEQLLCCNKNPHKLLIVAV